MSDDFNEIRIMQARELSYIGDKIGSITAGILSDPTSTSSIKWTHAVTVEKLYEDAVIPSRATAQSAGHDLSVYIKGRNLKMYTDQNEPYQYESNGEDYVFIPVGYTAILPLGFKATLPSGTQAEIRARSSVGFKKGLIIPNAPGTIDADYPDEWGVIVRNVSAVPVRVDHLERIGQAVIISFESPLWIIGKVGITTDRVGGVGSTGK
jgi:dUTP pyrophosphatase